MITIADCHRSVQLEFFLGSKRQRRMALAKLDLLIKFLTMFRKALVEEIGLIEKEQS